MIYIYLYIQYIVFIYMNICLIGTFWCSRAKVILYQQVTSYKIKT